MVQQQIRRGLPRVAGGEPWPPAELVAEVSEVLIAPGDTPNIPDSISDSAAATAALTVPPEVAPAVAVASADPVTPAPVVAVPAAAGLTATSPASSAVRRGLPRVAGGDPWPPAGRVAVAAAGPRSAEVPAADVSGAAVVGSESTIDSVAAAAPTATGPVAAPRPNLVADASVTVRRGLPRVAGGDPWPPVGLAPQIAAPQTAVPQTAAPVAGAVPAAAGAEVVPAVAAPVDAAVVLAPSFDTSKPLPFTRTVWPGVAPRHGQPTDPAQKARPGWTVVWAGLFAAAALGILAGSAVLFVRWFLSVDFMAEFLVRYPGEYHLPDWAPVGFPAWLNWQHFFNVFLMVLIIRSGIRVRREDRPTTFWASKRDPKAKVSLNIWFHQALDLLWITNGVVFVVLLFISGQWVRLVPTSWEVFPNALSAVLQYISLDWPTENGWVNYNSVQQIAYFLTVFVAAPLAVITGVRMSGLWPKNSPGLNRVYPVEWARAIHFPVMIYFVAFIAVHVTLVATTGFLRNLNHMFAASDAAGWTGFWFFIASLVAIVIAWVAARPIVLAPIAKLFGTVSGR